MITDFSLQANNIKNILNHNNIKPLIRYATIGCKTDYVLCLHKTCGGHLIELSHKTRDKK